MRVHLLHTDRDFDSELALPAGAEDLARDLELETVWQAMAQGDKLVYEVARRATLRPLTDLDEIRHRQAILRDCLAHPDALHSLYTLAGEAIAAPRGIWGSLSSSPRSILDQSVRKLAVLATFLAQLRDAAAEHAPKLASPGLTRLCAMLAEELDCAYLERVGAHLRELKFKDGIVVSARLQASNRGAGYTLRRPREQGRLARMFDRSGYSFTIPERDVAGLRALSELEDRAVNLVANAIAQSVDHVLSFLIALRTELAFYVGAVNLAQRLHAKGEPTAMPVPRAGGAQALSAAGLYDVSLSLTVGPRVVGGELAADGRRLVMITGANQGGKSTFMRALGLSQLMLQSGLFVGAESFSASVATALFSHYKREEDTALRSGKLDEELSRMSAIADAIGPGALLLCNESFAATNEREGSEIARQVVNALLDCGVRIVFVTHLFDLADSLHRSRAADGLFLRAERGADGERPYKLIEAPPLQTSYGADSYRKVFGHDPVGSSVRWHPHS